MQANRQIDRQRDRGKAACSVRCEMGKERWVLLRVSDGRGRVKGEDYFFSFMVTNRSIGKLGERGM